MTPSSVPPTLLARNTRALFLSQMTDLVFFYGTLMRGFKRPGRSRIDPKLTPVGRGTIKATLFDLGIYPAAIPASDERVFGEVHRMSDVDGVLAELDEIEGYRPSQPDASLYTRVETPVTLSSPACGLLPALCKSMAALMSLVLPMAARPGSMNESETSAG